MCSILIVAICIERWHYEEASKLRELFFDSRLMRHKLSPLIVAAMICVTPHPVGVVEDTFESGHSDEA